MPCFRGRSGWNVVRSTEWATKAWFGRHRESPRDGRKTGIMLWRPWQYFQKRTAIVTGRQSMASMKVPLSSRKGADFVGKKSSATSSSPSASVGLPSFPIRALGKGTFPSSQHPLSPRRREIPDLPSYRILRAGADVACTLKHLFGIVPEGTSPLNEIRKTPPFTRTTVPRRAPGRHAMLRGRLCRVVTSTATGSTVHPAQVLALIHGLGGRCSSRLCLRQPLAHRRGDNAGHS